MEPPSRIFYIQLRRGGNAGPDEVEPNMATKFISVENYGFDRDGPIAASRPQTIGFVGAGNLASRVASRLLLAGYHLKVCDPAAGEVAAIANGASYGNTCRSDAVLTMLPNEELVQAVVLGRGGVCEYLPRTAVHIGSSRISVELADKIVEAHWDAGKRYVSAPVSRDPRSISDELLLMVGGSEEALIETRALLNAVGEVTAQFSGWPSQANLLQLGWEEATVNARAALLATLSGVAL
jgi:NAD binding domain of 6-phosphogluconate dehydrogenase